jgi:hypothetical protein
MPQKTLPLALLLAGIALCGSSQISAQGNAIDTYCATCHNGRLRSPSGPLLDRLDSSRIATNPDLIRARQILRSTPNPRWSALIAAVVQ